jgi:outer membrane protein assembly factor BamB
VLPPQAWVIDIGSPIWFSPVTAFGAGGLLYVVPSGTGLHGIVEDSGGASVDWTFEIEGGCATDPAVSPSYVYVGSHMGILYSVDVNTGVQQWDFNVTSPFVSPTIDIFGNIFLGTHSGDVLAITPQGQIIWNINVGSAVRTPMSITQDGKLLVGTDAGIVSLLGPR